MHFLVAAVLLLLNTECLAQPAFNTRQLGTCDFSITTSQTSCQLSDLSSQSSLVQPGSVNYTAFTNLQSAITGISWGSYAYTISLSPVTGQSAGLLWAFGVAVNQAAMQKCLSALYNQQTCDSSEAWGIVSTRVPGVMSTLNVQGGQTYAGQTEYLVTSTNVTNLLASGRNSFVVFTGSLSETSITLTFSTSGVVASGQFGGTSPPPPSSSGSRSKSTRLALLCIVLAMTLLI